MSPPSPYFFALEQAEKLVKLFIKGLGAYVRILGAIAEKSTEEKKSEERTQEGLESRKKVRPIKFQIFSSPEVKKKVWMVLGVPPISQHLSDRECSLTTRPRSAAVGCGPGAATAKTSSCTGFSMNRRL